MYLRKARSQLTPVEYDMLSDELKIKSKKLFATYLAFVFGWLIGAHRYYLGDTRQGIAMTLTLGGFGAWSFVDSFKIRERVIEKNEEIEYAIIQEILMMRD